jgi:hypothetical protein
LWLKSCRPRSYKCIIIIIIIAHHADALFLTQVYRGLIHCSSSSEIVGLRVPVRRIRDFPMFTVSSASKNCPSARCASAANVVCRDVDVFGQKPLTR